MSMPEIDYSEVLGKKVECPEQCGMCCLCQPEVLAQEVPFFRNGHPDHLIRSKSQDRHFCLTMKKGHGSCGFLNGRRCDIYPNRPTFCRQFPYHLYVSDKIHVDRYPETHPKDRRAYFESYFKSRLANASHFITISDFSKRELTELFDVPPEKITTIYLGGLEFTEPNPNFTEKLPDKYFLYLGNLEPRKNVPMLLRAYAEAKKKEKDLPKLILAGSATWLSDEIFETIKAKDLSDSVIIKGYVPLSDLPFYYRNALAFLFPSKYEGFGLPVLEAMGEGAPVIVSDSSSLPEVVGSAGILLPSDEEPLWTKALLDIFHDEKLREELSRKALERSKLFSWGQCAKETRAVYEKTLSLYF